MSFHYNKHNYLERHIADFLSRSLLTVPVAEYRRIMDLKGSTAKGAAAQRPGVAAFSRDAEGFLLCPYCDYRTKGSTMTDHVKMKHMQARFKCHWCDFSAFYRSEVRKHHHKERSHAELEFRTEELDLSQMLYRTDGTENVGGGDEESFVCDPEDLDVGSDSDASSDASSGPDLSASGPSATTPGNDDLIILGSAGHPGLMSSVDRNTARGSPGAAERNGSGSAHSSPESGHDSNDKFRCGYCSFTASLRVKVKMHCSKKHGDSEVKVIEPGSEAAGGSKGRHSNGHLAEHITRVDANDWKGTKFEQDLKRAGVSKLNLSSLFPKSRKSKHCVENESESEQNSSSDIKLDTCEKQVESGDTISTVRNRTVAIVKKESLERTDNGSVNESETEPEFKVPKVPSPVSRTSHSQRSEETNVETKDRLNQESAGQPDQENEHTSDVTNDNPNPNNDPCESNVQMSAKDLCEETSKPKDIDPSVNDLGKCDAATADSGDTKDDMTVCETNESDIADELECGDSTDIIVEPLDPEVTQDETSQPEAAENDIPNQEISENRSLLINLPEHEIIQTELNSIENRDQMDEVVDTEKQDGTESFDDACVVTDENTNHINKENTDPEGIVLKAMPNLTPVVLESGALLD